MLGIVGYSGFLLSSVLLNITPGADTIYILIRAIVGGLGIKTLGSLLSSSNNAGAESAWQTFQQGVLTNALNPKVALFFLSCGTAFASGISARRSD